MRKRFDGLAVGWKTIEDKLRTWSPLFYEGNKIRIYISFVYKEISQPAAASIRSRGHGLQAANSSPGTSSSLTRKKPPAPAQCGRRLPCVNSQFYCWHDPETKKHFKLDTNILGILVNYAEEGNLLRAHDDIPENIRQLIYKQEEEITDRKKLKRKRSDSSPPINITITCPGHHSQHSGKGSTEPTLEKEGSVARWKRPNNLIIPIRRNKALEKYYEWQQDQVDSPRWQQNIQYTYKITRDTYLDLKHVCTKVSVEYYTEKGVQLGVALSFIKDIPLWVEEALGM
ncbi:unnamed protein product [Clonostachys rosea f. rosea IK726]|uniref:Uncharacterized protein n=2 Tax=Bionectria ochroleuca TaxID=29856 RepID=A0ACA9UUG5_BIOOC|nr:unnamed protein product [Clonostachys rosea f. rosea IK726]